MLTRVYFKYTFQISSIIRRTQLCTSNQRYMQHWFVAVRNKLDCVLSVNDTNVCIISKPVCQRLQILVHVNSNVYEKCHSTVFLVSRRLFVKRQKCLYTPRQNQCYRTHYSIYQSLALAEPMNTICHWHMQWYDLSNDFVEVWEDVTAWHDLDYTFLVNLHYDVSRW